MKISTDTILTLRRLAVEAAAGKIHLTLVTPIEYDETFTQYLEQAPQYVVDHILLVELSQLRQWQQVK